MNREMRKILLLLVFAVIIGIAVYFITRDLPKSGADDVTQSQESLLMDYNENEDTDGLAVIRVGEEEAYTEAGSPEELAEQIEKALKSDREESILFLTDKLRYENGQEGYGSYSEEQIRLFQQYMKTNKALSEELVRDLKTGVIHIARADEKYIVAFPLICFQLSADMENTIVSIDGFDRITIGTQGTVSRGPLLPMEYTLTATNEGWSEPRQKKVNVDLTNENIEVSFTSGEQAVHAGGHVIAIDPGHQKEADDSKEPLGPGAEETKNKMFEGAVGSTTGVPEYQRTLQIGEILKQELISRGYEVVMTRESNDVNISSSARAEIANASGAEILIAIHMGENEDESICGAQGMAATGSNPYCGGIASESKRLAEDILNTMCSKCGADNRGVKTTDQISIINWSQMPAAVIETGYMTNRKEDEKMGDENYQREIAAGIADGVDQFFRGGF